RSCRRTRGARDRVLVRSTPPSRQDRSGCMNLPEALPVESVSPSRFKDLTECQLRVAFKQHAAKSADKSDAQIIGDSLHAAMAAFAAAREFERADAIALVEARFSAELNERAAGREVRGGRPAAARLKKLAVR